MGWTWPFSSSDSTDANDNNGDAPKRGIGLTEEQHMRIFGRPSPTATSSSTTSKPNNNTEDAEIDAFVKAFGASETYTPPTQESQPPPEPKPLSRILPDGSLDISPEVMYPRTMSCRQAFDQAFYCQSLGGKFNDIYRYGSIQSCSEQWGAFWFCMRTNNLGPGREREERIQEYYRDREERRKKEHGSSEDVWEVRKVAVTRAFWRDPDADVEGEGKV